jgi:signal transduction histidine kinase
VPEPSDAPRARASPVLLLSPAVLFSGAGIIAFVAVTLLASGQGSPLQAAVHAMMSLVLGGGALATRREPGRSRAAAIVVGLAAAAYLAVIVHLGGGLGGRDLVWLVALPLCFLIAAPEHPVAVGVCAATAVSGVVGLGLLHAHPPADLLLLTSETALLGALATFIARRNLRLRMAGLEAHERELAAGRQLAESERQRADAERMASLGRLAAGVGHEINNPLTYVIQSLDLVREDLTGPRPQDVGELRVCIDHARDGAFRIRDIVRELRNLARPGVATLAGTAPAEVLAGALRLVENQIRHRARLVVDVEGVPSVRAEPGRLAQVFVNLLVNAVEAVAAGDPLRNEIGVRMRPHGDEQVSIEIWDTGTGIPPEDLARVFEPSYTTKAGLQGTGLGLSISRRIVEDFGGSIELHSELGAGTRFTILLARGERAPASVTTPAPVPIAAARGRVLVVDDEPDVLRGLARALGRQHDVTTAAGGREALSRVVEESAAYDLILCDLMMPDMDGAAFYRELSRLFPGSVDRVVFMSGGVFRPEIEQFVDSVPNLRLDKPCDLVTLRELVAARLRTNAA